MGGKNKAARLPMCLVAIMALWGIATGAVEAANDWHFDPSGRVQADISFDCSREDPSRALASLGFSLTASVKLASWCVVEGWIAPAFLDKVVSIEGITRVQVPSYAVHPRLSPSAYLSLHASAKLELQPSA